MQEKTNLQNCSENDVLEFESGAYRIKTIIDNVQAVFAKRQNIGKELYQILKDWKIEIEPGQNESGYTSYQNWFDRGIDCEILKVNSQGWQKGKVKLKITLEFEPDEPEETNNHHQSDTSLDDIRQIMQ